MNRLRAVLAAVVGIVVVVGVLAFTGSSGGTRHVTAYFPRAVGLYKNSSVRILGVAVGKITKITPEGTRVRVDMTYGSQYRLPADAVASIVPPSIVSDRYIQLGPPYRGGPVMADHAVIPESRTEVPVELDQIFADINKLNTALGPNGANKNGALSHLINISAANLNGNGQLLNTMLHDFSTAIGTLSDNRDNLFGTLSNLQQFTTTLANDDGGVRRVSSDLAQVSVQLNSERQELGAAFRNLSIALGQVATFVQANRTTLTTDIHQVASVTSGILTEKRALIEFMDNAPVALQNLGLAYDPQTQTLRTRSDNQQSGNPCAPTGLEFQVSQLLNLPICPSSPSKAASVKPLTPPTGQLPSAAQSLSQLLGVG